ncbi:MAG TPA: ABC transporter ATP-binding protein [Acidimicrobiaceae bacterium]|nr:ABC transporter ATP-binding protein [Acidimicrobiaceae bacterium]HCB37220.1 ABC transporter ATP-binding protein [Acidimicrobiaceae bacterium]
MAQVSLTDLTKVYDNGFQAVDRLSVDIADGEFLVLVGPSGCGKSTALRMVAGLESISSGELTIAGEAMNDVEPRDRNVAMVFQNYALYPHLDVGRNIAFPLRLAGLPRDEVDAKVAEAARILELGPLLGNKPAQLSGGQRQRVAMGRAIVRDPAVFLMDEPLSNLDAKLRVQMRAEITRLQHRLGATTLYVTHDQVEAMTMGDRVAVLKDGVLQQIDEPSELYRSPKNVFVAGFIGAPAMNLRKARLVAGGGGASGGGGGASGGGGGNGSWSLELGSARLTLDDSVLGDRPALAGYDGREVVVGIRPESMDDAAFGGDDGRARLSATAELTEALGADLLVHFPLDAPAVDSGDPDVLRDLDDETLMVARVDPRSRTRPGDRLELLVDTGRFHFFDPDTRLAIRA